MYHGLSYKQHQTSAFSVSAEKQIMSRLAVAIQMVDRSTVGDWQLWNFYLRIDWQCRIKGSATDAAASGPFIK